MPLTNRELARRVDLAISDLSTDGGYLLPEQANAFIDMIEAEPTIVNQARVVRMNSHTMRINRLGFGSRVLQAARTAGGWNDDGSSDRHLLEAERSKPVTTQIELVAKELMAEVHLTYEVLEDNIEKGNFEQHVMSELAKQVARDVEEWVLAADTASGDPFLALTDGLIKQATSNVVNNVSAGLTPDTLVAGMQAMPQQYLRDLGQLKHWFPMTDVLAYRQEVAKRSTGYGDSVLTTDARLFGHGVEIEPAALMPAATGIFTFPQNIIVGFTRDITVETDRDIRGRTIIIVVHMRADVKFDLEEAVVKYINL